MLNRETELVCGGNTPEEQHGYASPPVYRGSTVLYRSVAELELTAQDPYKLTGPAYGRFGNPNSRNFESLLAKIEGGVGSVSTVSGLAAITTAILSFVQAGDHILVSDSVYFPTRRFCDSLVRLGVQIEYYIPTIGSDIVHLMKPETRLVYMESPGSMTFDLQDVPAIAEACRQKNVISMIDNTWATPLYFQPLKLGVNISIHSATKYITGHADSFLGVIICDQTTFLQVRRTSIDLGQKPGAEDVHLALRGLRTLAVRLQQHDKSAREIAEWLSFQGQVRQVLHPALTNHPQHRIWKRDFAGACGLFSIEFKEVYTKSEVDHFIESLQLFGLGHSWGGFESLIAPGPKREGYIVRLHIGLENVADLKADLAQALLNLPVRA